MQADFKLTGFDELHKALGKFTERTERQLSMTALRAGGRVVIKNAAQNAPVDEGLLQDKNSWMSKAGRYRPGEDITLIVGTKGGRKFGWYAHLVEFGTAHSRARPFFRPAFDEHAAEIIEAVGASLTRGIPRAVERGRR